MYLSPFPFWFHVPSLFFFICNSILYEYTVLVSYGIRPDSPKDTAVFLFLCCSLSPLLFPSKQLLRDILTAVHIVGPARSPWSCSLLTDLYVELYSPRPLVLWQTMLLRSASPTALLVGSGRAFRPGVVGCLPL